MSARRARIAYVVGTWFGVGRVPRIPGTAGSIAGAAIYAVLHGAGRAPILAFALLVAAIGVWAASVVASDTGDADPAIVVVDEVAGVLVALGLAQGGWGTALIAFAAFRVCDQVKPWPARAAERLPAGWGIVADDLVAGLQAALLATALSSP